MARAIPITEKATTKSILTFDARMNNPLSGNAFLKT
jgi:hypothetical protein